MADLNEVIKGLEVCRDMDNPPGYRFMGCEADCPYFKNGCARRLKEEALDMLKGQKEKTKIFVDAAGVWHPIRLELEPVDIELEGGGSTWWYVCGECHGTIDERDAYCRHCGRKLRKQ